MKHIDIEQRRKKILFAIVESYIETAAPVGSRTISQRFGLSMSPATIRNVMADLEEMGLISHPHTSAGRVPSDMGYRFYVDSLLEPKQLTKEEELKITKLINRSCEHFESLMRSASKAICMITNIAGVVLTPRFKRSVFKHIEFINIDSSRVLAVLVTRSGIVKHAILDFEYDVTRNELFRIAEFLNEELNGMFMGDIKDHLTRRLLEESDSFYTFLKKAIAVLSSPSLLKMEDTLYYEGATALMSYPEFQDINMARSFLRILEERKDILDIFSEDMETPGVKVHIGKENTSKAVQNYTVVTCNYSVNDIPVGVLGAIGPRRMEYGKVISVVKYLSVVLGKALEHLG